MPSLPRPALIFEEYRFDRLPKYLIPDLQAMTIGGQEGGISGMWLVLEKLKGGTSASLHSKFAIIARQPQDGRIIGWLYATHGGIDVLRGELGVQVFVDPAHRRTGVGSALIDQTRSLIAKLGADGIHIYKLRVYPWSDTSRAFFRRLGLLGLILAAGYTLWQRA
jgi:GNAT superfamily N-acetyltransferase